MNALVPLVGVVLLAAACSDSHDGSPADRSSHVGECGSDAGVLDAELATGLQAIANVCASLQSGSVAAHARDAETFSLVHLRDEVDGPRTVIELDRYVVSLATSELRREGQTCRLSFDASTPTAKVERMGELRLSPAGQLAYFRLRETEYMPDSSELGTRALVVTPDCTIVTHARPDYHGYQGSVLLISEDPSSLITSGVTLDGGRGLLRGPDVIAIGAQTGELQRLDAQRVLAVSGAGHGAVWLTLYDQNELEQGPFPVAGTELEGRQWPFRFEALDERGIVGRATAEPGIDHYLYTVPRIGQAAPSEPSTLFASERFSRVVPVSGSRRVLLQHDEGLLVVE
jgi:hypothetical protein